MADNVYRKTDVVGTSEKSIDDAITAAVARGGQTLGDVQWFEVSEIRGHVENGEVAHFQVGVTVGFTLADTKS